MENNVLATLQVFYRFSADGNDGDKCGFITEVQVLDVKMLGCL